MEKRVLIAVVLFNAERWVEFCLSKIVDSKNIDIVCINNASSDSTCRILSEKFPQVKVIESAVNLGFGKANNIAFEIFFDQDYDFLFLLNQDARIDIDSIWKLVTIIEEHNQIGILSPIHCANVNSALDFQFSNYLTEFNTPGYLTDLVLQKPIKKYYTTQFVNAALWLISKQCARAVGGFDPIFPHYGEDEDYCQRTRKAGFEVAIAPVVLAEHVRPPPAKRDPLSNLSTQKSRYFSKMLLEYKGYSPLRFFDFLRISRDFFSKLVKSALYLNGAKAKLEITTYFRLISALIKQRRD